MKFQIPSMHHSEVNRRTDRQTDKPKAICPSNFFKVGGIKMGMTDNRIKLKIYSQTKVKDRVSVPGGQNTGKLEISVCKTLCPQLYACH